MDHGRVGRVWATIRQHAREDGTPASLRHVCLACAMALSARGAGLSISRGQGLREPFCAAGQGVFELEELQFTMGEGPSVDAFDKQAPILPSDLSSGSSERRWPMFAPAAVQRGIRAMFAFPLQAGVVNAGVLTVYRSEQGVLSRDELADSLVYADAAMLITLSPGQGLADAPFVAEGYDDRRSEVHQAAGMVSVQLGISVEDALVRLRAHAYAYDRRLADVARDVVTRQLRFSPDGLGRPVRDDEEPGTGAQA